MVVLGFLLICAAFLGIVYRWIDYLDSQKSKEEQEIWIKSLLNEIERSSFSELGALAGNAVLGWFSGVRKRKILAYVALASVLLTALAGLVGPLVRTQLSERFVAIENTVVPERDGGNTDLTISAVRSRPITFFAATRHVDDWQLGRFSCLIIFVVNVVFDVATFALTSMLLLTAVKRSTLQALGLLALDAFFALCLGALSAGVLCASLAWSATPAISKPGEPLNNTDLALQTLFGETGDIYRNEMYRVETLSDFTVLVGVNSVNTLLSIVFIDDRFVDAEMISYSLTALVPSLIWILITVFFVLAKPLLPVVQERLVAFLSRFSSEKKDSASTGDDEESDPSSKDKDSDQGPSPFMTFKFLVGIIIAILLLVATIVRTWAELVA